MKSPCVNNAGTNKIVLPLCFTLTSRSEPHRQQTLSLRCNGRTRCAYCCFNTRLTKRTSRKTDRCLAPNDSSLRRVIINKPYARQTLLLFVQASLLCILSSFLKFVNSFFRILLFFRLSLL